MTGRAADRLRVSGAARHVGECRRRGRGHGSARSLWPLACAWAVGPVCRLPRGGMTPADAARDPVPAADPFDLQRFVRAQAQGGSFDTALAELRAGAKRSHWIWWVLPQLRGLGRSDFATQFGLASADEARAYLAHPLLGPRLRSAVQALGDSADPARGGPGAVRVLGEIDALKARSCLTLFAAVAPAGDDLFARALAALFEDRRCAATQARLSAA